LSRFTLVFAVALGFAIASTVLAGADLLARSSSSSMAGAQTALKVPGPNSSIASVSSPTYATSQQLSISLLSPFQLILQFFEDHSLTFAPTGWFLVGGLWIWRGRMKSRWEALGFDSEVFELFVSMRGGRTRVRLLNSLFMPKDRFQLAHELGMDWKAVDQHIIMLSKAGFVREQIAYGRVRMYELTSMGKTLLKLLKEMSDEEKGVAGIPGLPQAHPAATGTAG